MDEAFRLALDGDWAPLQALPNQMDAESVVWAIETAKALASGEAMESREEFLRVEMLGMRGTADLLCAGRQWSADLKSGQVRNYMEQQAAYAIGFMDAHFVEEWTVYLLFCDQEQVVTHRFTYEEAHAVVKNTIAKALSDEPPTPNEYCGWCAERFTCTARREQVGFLPSEVALIEHSSDKLREFILRAAAVEEFAGEARDIIKRRIISGEKVAGCSVVSKQGSKRVPAQMVFEHTSINMMKDVFEAYGAMSESKFRAIFEAHEPVIPFPDSITEQSPGSSYVRVSQPKATKIEA